MNQDPVKIVGNELKLAYNFAMATDILLRTIERRLRLFGGLKQEKKQAFKRFSKAVEDAAYWFDRAYEGDLEAATCGVWTRLDGYRQDANELIRVMMLYIDRTTTFKTYDELIAYLKSLPEGGIFSAEDLARYNFTAKCRVTDTPNLSETPTTSAEQS